MPYRTDISSNNQSSYDLPDNSMPLISQVGSNSLKEEEDAQSGKKKKRIGSDNEKKEMGMGMDFNQSGVLLG